ncbi:MAG: hypothetical protein COB66_08520 [Coxiella sp. (in: Bacteria)]|nr:MAG: hypothetical protein COB66_08520 [Coxiella sp. (in: g-proteobacteria)]
MKGRIGSQLAVACFTTLCLTAQASTLGFYGCCKLAKVHDKQLQASHFAYLAAKEDISKARSQLSKFKNTYHEVTTLDFHNVLDSYVNANEVLEANSVDLINQPVRLAKNEGILTNALLQKMDHTYLKR